MKRLIAATFVLASGTASWAQAPASRAAPEPLPVQMTYCIPGGGCLSCESEMPMARVNRLLEINLQDVEVLLFKPDPDRPGSRDWKWFETGEIFAAVVEHKNSGVGSRTDPPLCRDRAPLKGSIQPRDGVWSVTPSATTMENCEGPGPANIEPSRGHIQFDRPFHGRLTDEDSFADVVQVSPNSFLGRIESDGLVGESLLEVHSPTRMKTYFTTRSANAAIACVTRMSLDMAWESAGGPP